MLGAGWRRAHRLAGLTAALVPGPLVPGQSLRDVAAPLDRGEKSAIVKSVDANVPPDQPPSPIHGNNVDSPATLNLWRGLSATGITFETPTSPSSAQASVTSPGCGVTPYGLTY